MSSSKASLWLGGLGDARHLGRAGHGPGGGLMGFTHEASNSVLRSRILFVFITFLALMSYGVAIDSHP